MCWRNCAAIGSALDPAWFAPHLEFRFPQIGEVTLRGTTMELRHALEPWHVLGEEPAAGGTARYVDSSVERVQAQGHPAGWTSAFVLACNGYAVPLTPTERAGEYVGGVRFKAWAAAAAPCTRRIPAQTPLVFDVYDRWTGRSLGGMTHHVSHPGGRSYEHFPVNANEAEARRRSRFFPFGHTPGSMAEPRWSRSRDHPRTLDLRRVQGLAPQRLTGQPSRMARDEMVDGKGGCGRTGAVCWACLPASATVTWPNARATRPRLRRRKASPACCLARRPIRGASIRSRCRCRKRNSPNSKPDWRSARGCWMRSWPMFMARNACWPMARAAGTGLCQSGIPAAMPQHRRRPAARPAAILCRRPDARAGRRRGMCWPIAPDWADGLAHALENRRALGARPAGSFRCASASPHRPVRRNLPGQIQLQRPWLPGGAGRSRAADARPRGPRLVRACAAGARTVAARWWRAAI